MDNTLSTIKDTFAGKTLLITGGTGSFGSSCLKHFLTSASDGDMLQIDVAQFTMMGPHAAPPFNLVSFHPCKRQMDQRL